MVDITHPDQEPFAGVYLPYAYLKLDHANIPTVGPKQWSNDIIDDGRFAKCAAKNKPMVFWAGKSPTSIKPSSMTGRPTSTAQTSTTSL